MRIGIFAGDVVEAASGLDDVVDAARSAADEGFASFWMPQIFSFDALTALAVVGREVPGIELGTAVVPTYPRHPMMIAQQALTTSSACEGRLTLGIGLSHQIVIENMYGYSFAKPLRHMREYLSILMPLLNGEAADFTGETMLAHGSLSIPGGIRPRVLIAALGPKMLELAGTVADGTVTWMTGPKTLAGHTVPTIREAADKAGRPAPSVAAGLPICVTDDPDGARARANKVFQMYGMLPSYRAMLDREGLEGPGDVSIVGNEDQVREQLGEVESAGDTDLAAVSFGGSGDERSRTRALLRSLI
jgi:F420-dependent oxidoreductase-like protein